MLHHLQAQHLPSCHISVPCHPQVPRSPFGSAFVRSVAYAIEHDAAWGEARRSYRQHRWVILWGALGLRLKSRNQLVTPVTYGRGFVTKHGGRIRPYTHQHGCFGSNKK